MGLFDAYEDMRHGLSNSIPQHIRQISCDVRNCVYHDGDRYCTADRIAVGPAHATNGRETICATFRPRTLM